ncbi:MAG: transposase [Myxococcales bacterium]|nr:transposase [Myxococcales bacterium]
MKPAIKRFKAPCVRYGRNFQIEGKIYQRNPGGGGKPKYSNRIYFAAIVYVLKNGIIWNVFPSERFEGLGASAAHQKFQEWAEAGFFAELDVFPWSHPLGSIELAVSFRDAPARREPCRPL